MGQATLLPSYGLSWLGFFKRLGVCAVMALPILSWLLARHFRPHGASLLGDVKKLVKWVLPACLIYLICVTPLLLIIGAFAFAVLFAAIIATASAITIGSPRDGAVGIILKFTVSSAAVVATPVADKGAVLISLLVVLLVAVAYAVLIVESYCDKRTTSPRQQMVAVALITACLTSLLGAATYFAPQWASDPGQLATSKLAFTFLLFLGILPLCNALFDWVSVGFTRLFLRHISAGRYWAVTLILVDIFLGLLLTAGLFVLVLRVLLWMQAAGWGVDAKALVTTFRANPLDPQVSWIAMLAVTNMLPTLIHLVISFWGLVSAQIRMPREHVGAQVHSLLSLLDAKGLFVGPAVAAPQTSLILGSNGQAIAAKSVPALAYQPISTADLNALFNYLYVDHWLVLLTVLGVVVALWSQYLTVLAWFLGLLL
jgi:hypothetical protein